MYPMEDIRYTCVALDIMCEYDTCVRENHDNRVGS